MKIRVVVLLLIIINCRAFSQATKTHAADFGYYQMFQGGKSFPVLAGSFTKNRLFVSARYSYDVQDVFLLSAGYIFMPGERGRLKITPSAGILADRMMGVTPGLQVNFANKYWVIQSINQVMIDMKDHRHLNNAYDWTEINFIVKDYFRPGITLFEMYWWNQKKLDLSAGATIFGKVKSFQYYFYVFDFWKENKSWCLLGLSYVHSW